jgi:sec-independent protein translocase protein TatA
MFAEKFSGVLVGIGFGTWEIAIVAGVFVLLFGSAKLPKLFNNMGRSVNEFKAGMAQKPEALEDDSKEEAEEKETADV